MSYLDRDTLGMYKRSGSEGPGPSLMGADTLIGDDVYNHNEEDLGDIKEIMLDMRTGQVAYAVLSFGGILGMGEKLFAVPWERLNLDTVNKRFILDVEKDRLKNAPGFDKDHWPDMASDDWSSEISNFYGTNSLSGFGGMTGTRSPSAADLRSGASMQSGSGSGSMSGGSQSGGSVQSDTGRRSKLDNQDDINKRS
ncbi:PRC-barrel domain-containing protein [Janthinobacterium agaricidamnosum]|uniref:PRC-barrel domain protein n=1 Tax=Janthinobacterium agaricidamnosum NBRC 102515 = DSM 9628 TaxID=1349767 RepID=W0V276_9BURK|nr:PRC-barrel domain-containing protein [Janthinobacterium agaricidamnosum]CDG81956.1 PRC-barrel domain protein [Janthinobacterium agaricidamnosum NBRC 102515 = DSM 9628]